MSLVRVAVHVLLVPLIACLVTFFVRNYALTRGVMDIPNQRSAHQNPTPRGGGVVIVLVVLTVVGECHAIGALDIWSTAALSIGGSAVAGIGWLDDHRPLSARIRGGIHVLAASLAVYCLGGSGIDFGGFSLSPNWTTYVLSIVAIVWSVNLYNFMDGTDGLAGTMAIAVGTVGAVVLWLKGADALALISFSVALASAGFLVWNWPPASVFMGDVGSGFLGYEFATLAFAGQSAGVSGLVWALLLAPFIADATYTLCWRMWRGEVWYAAHRTHAYQQLLNLGWSHARILRGWLLLNMVLIIPLTAVGFYCSECLPLLTLLLFLALFGLWWRIQVLAQRTR